MLPKRQTIRKREKKDWQSTDKDAKTQNNSDGLKWERWIYTLLSHTSQTKHHILQSQHQLLSSNSQTKPDFVGEAWLIVNLTRQGRLPQRLLPRPAVRHPSSPSPPRRSNGCSAPEWSWPDVSAERKQTHITHASRDRETNATDKLWN